MLITEEVLDAVLSVRAPVAVRVLCAVVLGAFRFADGWGERLGLAGALPLVLRQQLGGFDAVAACFQGIVAAVAQKIHHAVAVAQRAPLTIPIIFAVVLGDD